MKSYMFLAAAIVLESIGTAYLKQSDQFTKLIPSLVTIGCYALSFYFLSHSLKTLHVGIAYAIWSGVGIVLITLVGVFAFKQIPDLPAVIGLLLIIAGVVIINVWSQSAH